MQADQGDFHRVQSPRRGEEEFAEPQHTAVLDAEKGISVVQAPVKGSGDWEAKTFIFDKRHWPDRDACVDWVGQHETDMSHTAPAVRVACFETGFGRRELGSMPTEDEMELINRYALEPLAPEDVYVREMRLTNDRWGKHHVRLSAEFQRSVIETIPGKSLLLGHPEVKRLAAEPIGRFFSAREWRDPDTGITWGLAKFYIVKTSHNEHARLQIDGGVWQYASIGMELDRQECSICGQEILSPKCPHVPGERYPLTAVTGQGTDPQACEGDGDHVYCGVTYRGRGTAIEGSIVYLPELNGTEVVAQVWQRQTDHAARTASLGQGVPAGQEEPARQETVVDLEMRAAQERVFRAAVVRDIERLAGLLGREAELATYRDVAGDDLAAMAAPRLLALCEDWASKWDEQTPTGRQATSTARDDTGARDLRFL